jgi:hypothetical protein
VAAMIEWIGLRVGVVTRKKTVIPRGHYDLNTILLKRCCPGVLHHIRLPASSLAPTAHTYCQMTMMRELQTNLINQHPIRILEEFLDNNKLNS